MSEWSARKLKDLTRKIGSGATPRGGANVYTTAGVALIRSQNVLDNAMKSFDIARITDDAAKSLAGVTVERGDVLINITGDSIARCAVVDPELLPARVNQHVAILRPTPEIDSRFLQRFLVNPSFKAGLIASSSGGTRNALTKAGLGELIIRFPRLAEQRAIAEVLGALDDKIAANAALVRTVDGYFMSRWQQIDSRSTASERSLESMISDSISGDWGVDTLGPTHTEEAYCVRGADLSNLQASQVGMMPTRYLKPSSLERRRIREGDIVIEMSGGSPTQSTGRAVLVTRDLLDRLKKPIVSSNFCRVLRLKEPVHSNLVYAMLRWDWASGEFFQFENGTTGIKNLAFKEYSARRFVPNAAPEELASFNSEVNALFAGAHAFGVESERLAAARDALLPQLMSGKLRVRDAESQVEGVL